MTIVANILFPADPYLCKTEPFSMFESEYQAVMASPLLDAGLFDAAKLDEENVLVITKPFQDPRLPLLYRGYSMRSDVYPVFYASLKEQGMNPIVSPQQHAEPRALLHDRERRTTQQVLPFEGPIRLEPTDLARYGSSTNWYRASFFQGRLLNICGISEQPPAANKPPDELIAECGKLGTAFHFVELTEKADRSWVITNAGDAQLMPDLTDDQEPAVFFQMIADVIERDRGTENWNVPS
ncbi:MAG: hypothetical protein ACI37P_07050 [Eggerthellaceae bacterium]